MSKLSTTDIRIDTNEALLEERLGEDKTVRFCVADVDLDDSITEGNATIILRDERTGETSEPIEMASWMDAAYVLEQFIEMTGDTDHCYLEGLYRNGEVEDGFAVYTISAGS